MPVTNLSQIPLYNHAINGNFDWWQRTEATTITVNTATSLNSYAADMIRYSTQGTTVKNFSIQKSSNVPTFAQSGFVSNNSYLYTQITGISSFAAADVIVPWTYWMEGFDYMRLHGKTVTFGFWISASVAGTYAFSMQNLSGNRCYGTSFTVNSANTYQFVSITVTLDTVNSNWTFDNTANLLIYIGLFGGANFAAATPNVWTSSFNAMVPSGCTNWMATTGATLIISQFSIVEGAAPLATFTRRGQGIQQELALCQRYFEKSYNPGTNVGASGTGTGLYAASIGTGTGTVWWQANFAVQKRNVPTVTAYNPATGASNSCDRGGTPIAAAVTAALNNTSATLANTATTTSASGHSVHWTAESGL